MMPGCSAQSTPGTPTEDLLQVSAAKQIPLGHEYTEKPSGIAPKARKRRRLTNFPHNAPVIQLQISRNEHAVTCGARSRILRPARAHWLVSPLPGGFTTGLSPFRDRLCRSADVPGPLPLNSSSQDRSRKECRSPWLRAREVAGHTGVPRPAKARRPRLSAPGEFITGRISFVPPGTKPAKLAIPTVRSHPNEKSRPSTITCP
jgi:hypothetical protein